MRLKKGSRRSDKEQRLRKANLTHKHPQEKQGKAT